MHAISSYRGNRPTHTQTNRQDWLQYTAPLASTQCNKDETVTMKLNTRYWRQRADKRHGNPPEGNQERLVVKGKDGRAPGKLGVNKSVASDIFPFSALDTVGRVMGRASGL